MKKILISVLFVLMGLLTFGQASQSDILVRNNRTTDTLVLRSKNAANRMRLPFTRGSLYDYLRLGANGDWYWSSGPQYANVGAGALLYKGVGHDTAYFKSLVNGTGISLTNGTNTVTIVNTIDTSKIVHYHDTSTLNNFWYNWLPSHYIQNRSAGNQSGNVRLQSSDDTIIRVLGTRNSSINDPMIYVQATKGTGINSVSLSGYGGRFEGSTAAVEAIGDYYGVTARARAENGTGVLGYAASANSAGVVGFAERTYSYGVQGAVTRNDPNSYGGAFSADSINGIPLMLSQSGFRVKFKMPSTNTNTYTLTLPTTDGDANQLLKTDGNGVLSWTTPTGGTLTWADTLNQLATDYNVALKQNIADTSTKDATRYWVTQQAYAAGNHNHDATYQAITDTSTKDATRYWVQQQNYLTANQSVSLSGDVTGSGTTSISTTIADNAVDGTDISLSSEAEGDIMYFNGTDWVRLAGAGNGGKYLKMNTQAMPPVAYPSWATVASDPDSAVWVKFNDTLTNGGKIATKYALRYSPSSSGTNSYSWRWISGAARWWPDSIGTGTGTGTNYWDSINAKRIDSRFDTVKAKIVNVTERLEFNGKDEPYMIKSNRNGLNIYADGYTPSYMMLDSTQFQGVVNGYDGSQSYLGVYRAPYYIEGYLYKNGGGEYSYRYDSLGLHPTHGAWYTVNNVGTYADPWDTVVSNNLKLKNPTNAKAAKQLYYNPTTKVVTYGDTINGAAETDPVWSSEKSSYSQTNHTHSISNVTALQDSLNDRYRRKDTATVISSKDYMTTYVGNRFSALGHNHSGTYWAIGDTATTLSSKTFMETYTGNRFSALGHNHNGTYQAVSDTSTKDATRYWVQQQGYVTSSTDSRFTTGTGILYQTTLADRFLFGASAKTGESSIGVNARVQIKADTSTGLYVSSSKAGAQAIYATTSGTASNGIYGATTTAGYGIFGQGSFGALGGVYGASSGDNNTGYGGYFMHNPGNGLGSGYGVAGVTTSTTGTGVYGSQNKNSNTGYAGYFTNSPATNDAASFGVYAINSGTSANARAGYFGLPTPSGSAKVLELRTALPGNQPVLSLSDGSNYLDFKLPTLSSSYTFTLPVDDGTANQVLKTDGSGVLSWTDQTGGTNYWQKNSTNISPATSGDDLLMNSGETATLNGGLTVRNGVTIAGTKTNDNAADSVLVVTGNTVKWRSAATLGGGTNYWQVSGTDIKPATGGNDLLMGTTESITANGGLTVRNGLTIAGTKTANASGDSLLIVDGNTVKYRLSSTISGSATHTIDSVWHVPASAARASVTTFTFTGTPTQARQVLHSLFVCTSSSNDTVRFGYISAASESGGTVTCTVVANASMQSGDKKYRVAWNRKVQDYQHLVSIPGEIIADASNPQGLWYLNTMDTVVLLPVDVAVRTAAAGAGAACAFNVYSGTSNLFSAAPDMTTNTTLTAQRPTTIKINPAQNVSLRITSSAGGTNKASDFQARLFLVPSQLLYGAF